MINLQTSRYYPLWYTTADVREEIRLFYSAIVRVKLFMLLRNLEVQVHFKKCLLPHRENQVVLNAGCGSILEHLPLQQLGYVNETGMPMGLSCLKNAKANTDPSMFWNLRTWHRSLVRFERNFRTSNKCTQMLSRNCWEKLENLASNSD